MALSGVVFVRRIMEDPDWANVQQDMARMAIGIKNEVVRIEREVKAKKAKEAGEEPAADPEPEAADAEVELLTEIGTYVHIRAN